MRRMVLATAVMALGGLGVEAAAQERVTVWSGWADGGYGGAVDCTDCFEDEYLALTCEREGGKVVAELAGLVPGDDAAGARLEVRPDVDGQSETRLAAIEDSEMFGPIPVLMLAVDDPLFARLRAGTTLTLSTEGDSVAIPLARAAEALGTMFYARR